MTDSDLYWGLRPEPRSWLAAFWAVMLAFALLLRYAIVWWAPVLGMLLGLSLGVSSARAIGQVGAGLAGVQTREQMLAALLTTAPGRFAQVMRWVLRIALWAGVAALCVLTIWVAARGRVTGDVMRWLRLWFDSFFAALCVCNLMWDLLVIPAVVKLRRTLGSAVPAGG